MADDSVVCTVSMSLYFDFICDRKTRPCVAIIKGAFQSWNLTSNKLLILFIFKIIYS